jgi:hypothetical protein
MASTDKGASFVTTTSLDLVSKSIAAMANAALVETYTRLCQEGARQAGEARDFNFQVCRTLKREILRRLQGCDVAEVTCLQAADTVMFEFPVTASMLRQVGLRQVGSSKPEGEKS